ncbi:hypothetical protein SAMN05421827_1408 [Pedobacter terrae]|uniref:Glycosyl transferases group 1 n=1 Tax=Pedobacter terrae TaxID=405671 RepID=A0A1G8EKB8_9SPHI|nr:glycosyltransferase [Pedobacter terrae]SDH70222.1 hypothetical protein SAMN05421827_1408 [Pedobacter terrae]
MLATIIGCQNGVGLEKDKDILTEILIDNDITVEFRNVKYKTPINPKTTMCIHTEVVEPYFLGKRNILIPNQEWFLKKWLIHLKNFDAIFCKTLYAKEIFSKYHDNVIYTGFTSKDCYVEVNKKMECFHAQGRSKVKGTQFIIEAWEKQNLPKLNLVSKKIRHKINTENIKLYKSFLPSDHFNQLRNESMVHLCPSEAEGFGHYINESKSCGAAIITTGFAPMNELINEFTLPIYKKRQYANMMGERVTVRPSDIGKMVSQLFQRNDLHEIGMRNRQNFIENDSRVRRTFSVELNKILI